MKARLLVIADGATSRLATKLGYCTEAPRGVCSRAFVKGGTHNTDFDGMPSVKRDHAFGAILCDAAPIHNIADTILKVFVAGVCFYQKESLPGYSAIFKHPDDELNFCYYLIPYGKDGYCGDVKVRVPTS